MSNKPRLISFVSLWVILTLACQACNAERPTPAAVAPTDSPLPSGPASGTTLAATNMPVAKPSLAPTRFVEPTESSPVGIPDYRPPTRTPPDPTRSVDELTVEEDKLRGVAIKVEDLDDGSNQGDYWSLKPWVFSDVTAELGTACLLDCSKSVFEYGRERITVSILRAGDPEKAERTVVRIHDEILNELDNEYDVGEFRDLRALSPNSWVILRGRGYLRYAAAGAARGVIVVWTRVDFNLCTQLDNGTMWCEGDLESYADLASWITIKQLEKAYAAGY